MGDFLRRAAAVLLVHGCVLSLSLTALADERTDARREFKTGMQKIADGDYDAAVTHLETAYGILPHPNVLYNIALAHIYAGRPDQALKYFQRYQEMAPEVDASDLEQRIIALREATNAKKPEAAPGPTSNAADQQRAELDVADAALRELRIVAEASNSDALRSKATQLESESKRLREQQEKELQSRAQTSPETTQVNATMPGAQTGDKPSAPPSKQDVRTAEQGVYEEEVVSASRFKEAPLDAPNSISIITAQDIRLTGLTNIPDLLRRVAGVEITSVTPNHAEVSIRGLNRRTSNKLLLLVDGRSHRLDFLGTNWFSFLPFAVEDIERIEIIRGPASALYGADAFSGIINVITRAPGDGKSFLTAGYGNKDQARGAATFTGRRGDFAYRASFGYQQSDNSRLTVGPNRVDEQALQAKPDYSLQKKYGSAEVRYTPAPKTIITVGGGAVEGKQTVQGLGRLTEIAVPDGSIATAYAQAETPIGVKLSSWWHHLKGDSGLVQYTPGAINPIANNTQQDIADVDLSWTGSGNWLLPQTITVGAGYRFKYIDWSWLDTTHRQHHYAAYLQDVIQVVKQLRVQFSARLDRHPLLDTLQFSPRGSIVYRITEGQSLRATVGRAFRGPSFSESYTLVSQPTPLRGVAAYGVGDPNLDQESIISYELGYLNQSSDYFAFEANAYVNMVKDIILFTKVDPFTLSDYSAGLDRNARYLDGDAAFPVSASGYTNQRATYRQVGGELGVRLFPVQGLDVYGNYALHDTSPVDKKDIDDPVLAKQQQTSMHKVNAGVQYRSKFGLDVSADLHWISSQVWVEQLSDAARGLHFEAFHQPQYTLVNGRLGYRVWKDTLELGLVGTNLTFTQKRQHPWGQPMDTRVLGTATVRF